jgi:hypothetical protein
MTKESAVIVEQFNNLEGSDITDIEDKTEDEMAAEAHDSYNQVIKQYSHKNDPEIAPPRPYPQRRIRYNKDKVASLVANADLLGYTAIEAAQFITNILYPEKEDGTRDGQFTKHQYTTWHNKLKANKIMHVGYYSRAGLFEDVYDIRETVKITYQHIFRQFRREVVKPDGEQDKGYIIKLGYLIKELSEERMKVSMSIPYIQNLKLLINNTLQREHELRQKYPTIFEVSSSGDISTVLPAADAAESGDGGDGETISPKALYQKQARQGEAAGSGEGSISGDADDGAVQSSDGTAGTGPTERVF